MKVPVVMMVVAVILSTSTLEYSEAIASEELCEQIRLNQREILTMGARGRSHEDAHFYILTTGGYMFKVPLSNLRVNAALKTTSVTIDREHILADFLLEEFREKFTRKSQFFFVSNPKEETFLARLKPDPKRNSVSSAQLYNLDGALPSQPYPLATSGPMHVMASVGIGSNIAYGCELISNRLLPRIPFELNNEGVLYARHLHKEKMMLFSSTTDYIVTVFYHLENPKKEDGYYYFLDDKGLLTVSPRKSAWDFATSEEKLKDLYKDRFEVNLSSFVVCHFRHTPHTTDPPTNGWTYWVIALCGVTIVVLVGFAFYLYRDRMDKKAKRRDSKQKDGQSKSNLSSNVASNVGSKTSSKAVSNASSSPTTSFMANKASSVLQSVKSTINGLLSRNQTKQAKTVAKVKKPKVKPKKLNGPK